MKKLLSLTISVFSTALLTIAQPCLSPPSVSISATSPAICAGTNDTLSAISPTAISYSWSTGETTSTITVAPISAVMGNYTVTVTDGNGCSASNSVSLDVNPLPDINITAMINPICSGGIDILSASNSEAGGTSWVWSTSETTDSIIIVPTTTTTYSITGTDSYGCVNSATYNVTVDYPPPTPVITAITGWDSVKFVASTGGIAASGPISYHWTATDAIGHLVEGDTPDTINLIYYMQNCTLNVVASYVPSPISPLNPCTSSTSITISHAIIRSYLAPGNLRYPTWGKRGMELAHSDYYILDTATHTGQDSIVRFCRRNKITYVLLEDLEGDVFGATTHYLDTAKARLLSSFIELLKDSGKVQEIGVVCYDNKKDSVAWNAGYYDMHFLTNSIHRYNWDFGGTYKIDILSMDDEFMDGVDSVTALKNFHKKHMPILLGLYQAAQECPSGFLRVEDYLEEPMNPGNKHFHIWDPTEVMEKDSIALCADRILNSCYSTYPNILYNQANFIMTYPVFGSDSNKPMELWPAFDPADSSLLTTCTVCFDEYGPADFLGDSLCYENKKPDYMEYRYYDSLKASEKIKKFTDEGNTSYTQFSMGGDTNFNIGGNFWFQYYCLHQVQNFDTGAAVAVKFRVNLGPNIQWFYPSVMPPRPITLRARVEGGTPPYHYIWYNDSDRTILQSDTLNTLVVHFLYPKKISVLAIDADTLTAKDYVIIYQMCNEGPLELPGPKKNSGNSQTDTPIKLYPNPNNGSFTLEYELAQGEVGKLVLFNELGEKMGEYILVANQNKMSITNNNLNNGVYYYQLYINNKAKKAGKIIIIK